MTQTNPRLDPVLRELFDETLVEVQTSKVNFTLSFRKHTRPRYRKSIGLHPQLSHQSHILNVAMIMIARHVSSVTIHNVSWSVGKTVPNRFALAILFPSTFDLVRRTCDAPDKAVRKSDTSRGHAHVVPPCLFNIRPFPYLRSA